jgi:RNA-binding protein
MELSKKNKLYLKKMAHHTEVSFIIGKNGITDNVVKAISDYLKAHEYMKTKVLELPEDVTIKDLAKELSEKTGSIIVTTIGHTIILFKRNPLNIVIKFPS